MRNQTAKNKTSGFKMKKPFTQFDWPNDGLQRSNAFRRGFPGSDKEHQYSGEKDKADPDLEAQYND